MVLFCPWCDNMLLVKRNETSQFKWFCRTCPYQAMIDGQVTTRVRLTRKEVDDIMGGEEAWKNVDSTDAPCPKCETPKAFYRQVQIRSADEPMTTFYRCTNNVCAHQWREG